MVYIDAFVLVVPKKKLSAYTAIAKQAAKVWREYGALEYRECIGDDLTTPCAVAFPKLAKAKANELGVFSCIAYGSKKQHDAVNVKVMKDERILAMMKKPMPFDMKRMAHGGFRSIVDVVS